MGCAMSKQRIFSTFSSITTVPPPVASPIALSVSPIRRYFTANIRNIKLPQVKLCQRGRGLPFINKNDMELKIKVPRKTLKINGEGKIENKIDIEENIEEKEQNIVCPPLKIFRNLSQHHPQEDCQNCHDSHLDCNQDIRTNCGTFNKGIIESIIKPESYFENETKFKVYVIECENDNFYVGVTKNMEERYKSHMEGNGSIWTTIHKPIKYYIHKEFDTRREANVEENALVLSLMYKHSIPRVRGGRFSNPILNKFLVLSLKTEMAHNESLCFQCLKPGHFIKECPNNKTVHV